MRQRYYKWDNLKCFLITTVVLGHFIESAIDSSDNFKSLWLIIYTFHMPLFVFVSGLFAKSTILDKGKIKDKIFFFIRLYLYYKIILFCEDIVFLRKCSFSLFSESGIPWYMLAMAMFIIITYCIRNIRPEYVLASSIILSCVIGYDSSINKFLVLARVINFYPFFLLGYYIKPDMAIFESSSKKKIISAVILILFGGITWLNIDVLYRARPLLTGQNPYYVFRHPAYGAVYRLIYFIVAFVLGMCIIYLIPNVKNKFTYIGTKTLQIYVIHGIMVRFFTNIHADDWFIKRLPNIVWEPIFILLAAIAMFICLRDVFYKLFIMIASNKYVYKK